MSQAVHLWLRPSVLSLPHKTHAPLKHPKALIVFVYACVLKCVLVSFAPCELWDAVLQQTGWLRRQEGSVKEKKKKKKK